MASTYDGTTKNTVQHWVLYALAAWEAEDPGQTRRRMGATAQDLFEWAGGEGGVFDQIGEVAYRLGDLCKPFEKGGDDRPVERRTESTTWDGPDVDYRARITSTGREELRELGRPTKLPDRRQDGFDRSLDGSLTDEIGWLDQHWIDRESPEDWVSTDFDGIYFRTDADADTYSGYNPSKAIDNARQIRQQFGSDVTVVITVGPYRPYKVKYESRDAGRVVNLDYYSAAAGFCYIDEIVSDLEDGGFERRGNDDQAGGDTGDSDEPVAASGANPFAGL